jgi:cyclopropane fatty-acyl-phospholipid synthase-like methyltransferase
VIVRRLLKDILRSRLGDATVRASQFLPFARFVLNSTYDPKTGFHVGSGDMRRDWDARARRNAQFFIAVDHAESAESFDSSGQRHLELMLQDLPWKPTWKALEIGCGVGRILKRLSKHISEVHGIDISEEMVRQARVNLVKEQNASVSLTAGDLREFASESFDFVYSYRVFQHIPERYAVERYIQEAARVLKHGGWLRFQLCTSQNEGARTKSGGTWFGVLFRDDDIDELVSPHGLRLETVQNEIGDAAQSLWDYRVVTCIRT